MPGCMKVASYFLATRTRPDRAFIQDKWIEYVIRYRLCEIVQSDGRIRRWARIAKADQRVLEAV